MNVGNSEKCSSQAKLFMCFNPLVYPPKWTGKLRIDHLTKSRMVWHVADRKLISYVLIRPLPIQDLLVHQSALKQLTSTNLWAWQMSSRLLPDRNLHAKLKLWFCCAWLFWRPLAIIDVDQSMAGGASGPNGLRAASRATVASPSATDRAIVRHRAMEGESAKERRSKRKSATRDRAPVR